MVTWTDLSRQERSQLIKSLNDNFGDKLTEHDTNYIVSSAQVLLGYLNKGYKCADEPD
jgi:hypothetical protein